MYTAALLGCDVLLLQTREDVPEKLRNLSVSFTVGNFGDIKLPEYDKNICIAENPRETAKPPARRIPVPSAPYVRNTSVAPTVQRREKSYEELAALAESVVMIEVLNSKGEPVSAGSGIMIGRDGYILTNCHVVSDGHIYAVRIENDNEVYLTNELIKYNTTTDLAVIRIKRSLSPVKVYSDAKPLVRGQKVIAIGSPLGLFNSVSDGIISGFREIRNVDMIQFTAPISHGSSGGAVFNTYGELIGISTAGIDKGQNINLAVGYKSIILFAKGFFRQ
ncbi:MAG: serine protease [Ruminococcus sp.]|nr:serine protease [Ruminococcus sp.]